MTSCTNIRRVCDLVRAVARRNPHAPAVMFREEVRSYGEVVDNAQRLASVLQSRLAIGDRVGILARNCPEYVEIYLALQLAGLIAVPINFRFVSSELLYVLQHSGARGLIIDAKYFDLLDEVRDQLSALDSRAILILGCHGDEENSYQRMIRSTPVFGQAKSESTDPSVIYYTSGTTGFPKGAVMSAAVILSRASYLGWELGITQRDTMLVPGPMFHFSFSLMALIPLCIGGKTVITDEFDPEEIGETIARRGITRSFMVPKMFSLLVESLRGGANFDRSSVRNFLSSGSALPKPIFEELLEYFPDVHMAESMGWTESGFVVCCPHEDMRRKNLSAGRAAFGCEMAILDDDGNELPAGQAGLIYCRPPMPFLGYYNNPEATAAMRRNGWETGGDIGYRDDEGFLYILDRQRDIIISGGENIYPAELERVAADHPGVLEVAAVGIPDEQWGEAAQLCVVTRPDYNLNSKEIMTFCEGKLARYKLPRSVVFLQALPRNSMGKVLRRELRERFWSEAEYLKGHNPR